MVPINSNLVKSTQIFLLTGDDAKKPEKLNGRRKTSAISRLSKRTKPIKTKSLARLFGFSKC